MTEVRGVKALLSVFSIGSTGLEVPGVMFLSRYSRLSGGEIKTKVHKDASISTFATENVDTEDQNQSETSRNKYQRGDLEGAEHFAETTSIKKS